jgi:hypothetical protein
VVFQKATPDFSAAARGKGGLSSMCTWTNRPAFPNFSRLAFELAQSVLNTKPCLQLSRLIHLGTFGVRALI